MVKLSALSNGRRLRTFCRQVMAIQFQYNGHIVNTYAIYNEKETSFFVNLYKVLLKIGLRQVTHVETRPDNSRCLFTSDYFDLVWRGQGGYLFLACIPHNDKGLYDVEYKQTAHHVMTKLFEHYELYHVLTKSTVYKITSLKEEHKFY